MSQSKPEKANSKNWPESLSFKAFKRLLPESDDWIYKTIYELRNSQISVQNQRIGMDKLGKILRATFKLSAANGFEAMSLRQLSTESGISMGGLYSYIGSKEELANLIEHVLGAISTELTDLSIEDVSDTKHKLAAVICSHLFLSEQLHPWFYFVYMESKSLSKRQKEKAKKTELDFENRIFELISEGMEAGFFKPVDAALTASAIMALLQDWQLKRWKHRGRRISVDQYSAFLLSSVMQLIEFTPSSACKPALI